MERHARKAIGFALVSLFALLPALASAQAFSNVVQSVVVFADTYVIRLLYAIAFIVFLYGIFRYFILESADEHARSQGRAFILWGLIGFVVLFSVWGLVNLLITTLTTSG